MALILISYKYQSQDFDTFKIIFLQWIFLKNIRRFLLIFLRTLSQVASSLGLSQLFLTDVSSSSLNRLLSSSSINDSKNFIVRQNPLGTVTPSMSILDNFPVKNNLEKKSKNRSEVERSLSSVCVS